MCFVKSLSYVFLCSRCGRSHTIEEYRRSRFCRDCGRFLSYRDRREASRVKRYVGGEWPLFPYEPYPPQLKFMRDIKNVVGDGGVLVVEACNGFGKTVCALSSVLPLASKIVYATRTHEQVRQVLLEIERVNLNSTSTFSAVSLASRQHLCLNDKCKNTSSIEALEACQMLREAGECPYKVEIGSLRLPPVLSAARLRKEGESRGVCPYFLARKATENCTVVVAPYQYVFNEHIRSTVKLELSNRILVFDEAHNADQIAQEVLSDSLSERTLENAKEELKAVEETHGFIDDLLAYLDRKVSVNVATEPGFKLREELEDLLSVEKLGSFADSFQDIVEEIRNHKLEQGDRLACHLNGVLTFLSLVGQSLESSYVAIYRRSSYGYNQVEYKCLDPSLAVKPVVDGARGALLMSGTLSPMQLFTEIMGLEKAEAKTYSSIADPENIRTIIDSSVTTRYSERGTEMTRRYGENLSKLVAKIPNGILVFFPQRKFMIDALDTWRKMGLMERREQAFLGGKPVFVEGSRASENRRVVEEYKKAARSKNGAVLCGVFRGRNAEGSNFPYEEARGIFLVGVPYADYSDPVVKAQIEYFNKKRKGLGDRWYVMDAFRAANQAMGRGIRHRDDWCNFFLMDHRYLKYQEFISKWAVTNGIQEITPQ